MISPVFLFQELGITEIVIQVNGGFFFAPGHSCPLNLSHPCLSQDRCPFFQESQILIKYILIQAHHDIVQVNRPSSLAYPLLSHLSPYSELGHRSRCSTSPGQYGLIYPSSWEDYVPTAVVSLRFAPMASAWSWSTLTGCAAQIVRNPMCMLEKTIEYGLVLNSL